jgi:hypothetical protein
MGGWEEVNQVNVVHRSLKNLGEGQVVVYSVQLYRSFWMFEAFHSEMFEDRLPPLAWGVRLKH